MVLGLIWLEGSPCSGVLWGFSRGGQACLFLRSWTLAQQQCARVLPDGVRVSSVYTLLKHPPNNMKPDTLLETRDGILGVLIAVLPPTFNPSCPLEVEIGE